MDKLAIITSGGGMRCSWGVGVMLCLAERFKLTEPDILISSSGSAGTGSYYVAKQYDSMRNIWGNLICSRKFLNFFRLGKILNVDYVIDDIFKKQDILDANAVYGARTNYYIPALNIDSGEIRYFSNRNKDDIFEAMRATKAMPVAYNRPVSIHGERYSDSLLSSKPETHLKKAIESGAKKVILIDNRSANTVREFHEAIFNLWLLIKDENLQRNYRKNSREAREYKVPYDVRVLLVKPRQTLKISTFDNNRILLKEAINQGYDETQQNTALARFLS